MSLLLGKLSSIPKTVTTTYCYQLLNFCWRVQFTYWPICRAPMCRTIVKEWISSLISELLWFQKQSEAAMGLVSTWMGDPCIITIRPQSLKMFLLGFSKANAWISFKL